MTFGRAIWPSLVIAFIVDLGADLAFGNATLNVITAISVFCLCMVILVASGANRHPSV